MSGVTKALLGFLVASFIGAPSWAGTAFVQSCSNRVFDAQSSLTCVFAEGVSSSSVIACGIFSGDQAPLASVTDNGAGNSYSIVETVSGADSARGYSVYATNVAGGATVVTAIWSVAANAFHAVVCHEI